MPGRVVLPMVDDAARCEFWKSSPVLQHPLLASSDMVASKDMVAIEDVSDAALPPSTDDATH
eukprot:3455497-Alexandrium_andersonii.AAC.1